jgi:hypothetical protein
MKTHAVAKEMAWDRFSGKYCGGMQHLKSPQNASDFQHDDFMAQSFHKCLGKNFKCP